MLTEMLSQLKGRWEINCLRWRLAVANIKHVRIHLDNYTHESLLYSHKLMVNEAHHQYQLNIAYPILPAEYGYLRNDNLKPLWDNIFIHHLHSLAFPLMPQ